MPSLGLLVQEEWLKILLIQSEAMEFATTVS